MSIIGRPVKLSLFSGGLLMYVAYDLTHYFLHFGTAFSEASRDLKVITLTHKASLLTLTLANIARLTSYKSPIRPECSVVQELASRYLPSKARSTKQYLLS